jgi:hypothetical protein
MISLIKGDCKMTNGESGRRSCLKRLFSLTALGAGSLLTFTRNAAASSSGHELQRPDNSTSPGKNAMSLEERISALEAVHEVQEVMSRYFHYHCANLHKECWEELFAHKAPDLSVEIADWGRWEGPEHVKALYCDYLGGGLGDPKGMMMVHSLDTPCIQVAGDGKTAKGVWFSPGHETAVENGKADAYWCWSYMAADFIKEDGAWKIWHYHVYAMFRTPFEKSWTDVEGEKTSLAFAFPKGTAPNKPITFFNEYTPTSIRKLVPAPPKPYETFNPSKAY